YPDVKIKTFAPEILAAMKEVNDQLLEEAAAKNEQFREILDSQRAYQAKARAWTVVSDYAYVKDNQGE
ncbi:MAG: ABC transporter substrate-binding protein, partial [Deltaproteobacteria bacterium]|nr:ABC transporter substrate-binding protein [Deltaproteobacteria bacterium]